MIWQNVKNFYGPNILMSTFFGDICKESHQKSDETIKTEIYEVLKKVYKNATMPTGLMNLLLWKEFGSNSNSLFDWILGQYMLSIISAITQ